MEDNRLASLSLSQEVLNRTPQEVTALLLGLMSCAEEFECSLIKHFGWFNKSSSSSSFRKWEKEKPEVKPFGKRASFRQKMLDPTAVTEWFLQRCPCGEAHFVDVTPFYTHQIFELPQIDVHVERLLSFRQTCHLQGKRMYPRLGEAFEHYLSESKPAAFFSGTREAYCSVNSVRSLLLPLKFRMVIVAKAILAVFCQGNFFSFFGHRA